MTAASCPFSHDEPVVGPTVPVMARMLMIDAENMLGARAGEATIRGRVAAIRDAAGSADHVVAAYAAVVLVDGLDVTASVLAELGIGVLRVDRGPSAADRALIAHARRVAASSSSPTQFVVASADGRFAELAALGSVEVIVWTGQPLSTRLSTAARRVIRVSGSPTRSIDTVAGCGAADVDACGGPPVEGERPTPELLLGRFGSVCRLI